MTNVILNVGGLTQKLRAETETPEWLDEADVDEAAPPVEKLSASEQTALLLDSVDAGLVLATAQGKILKRNRNAVQLLAAFGRETDVIPRLLFEKLDPIIASAANVPNRFTPSSPISAPARGKYFCRVRALRGGAFVLSIAAAALREIDVSRVLTEKFGLSAQEIRIAFFAAQGYRNREIADRLEVVEGTVKNYLTAVFSALSVRSRTELASELAQLVDEQDHKLEK